MDTKFVILVVISALLVAAIYSSSTSVVFAATTNCIYSGKNTAFCVTDDSAADVYRCDKQKDGTWKCDKIQAIVNVPPGLTDALDDATGPAGPLQEGGVLEQPESTESNNTFTRANISALE